MVVELGLDPQPVPAWYAYMAPRATPPAVVQRVNEVVNLVLREDATIGKLRDLGAAARITTPDETLTFMRAEQAKWGAVVRAGNIVVE